MSVARSASAEPIGHEFERPGLLALAFVHRSSVTRSKPNNEKLEFLGDAVLELVISDVLMERFPSADEGELSKRRAALVNAKVLAAKALVLDLGASLRLGKGEEKSGGRAKASILAAAYEAVIGAIFLDGGYAPARAAILCHFRPDLEHPPGGSPIDAKSRLQEITQRVFRETPSYTLTAETGPDHDRAFTAELTVGGKVRGRGTGKTKKDAEQQAAEEALASLEGERPGG